MEGGNATEPLLHTSSPRGKEDASFVVEENEKNALGTLNGCFIPCLLNILGAVLYLRIGFSVGQMGMLTTIGILAFSEGVAYLTIFSLSALITNGTMKGGGAYFLISRMLGPAFGGSAGLLFWFTYCINVTFNTVAFTGTFMPTFFPAADAGSEGANWSGVGCSSLTLFLCFCIAYNGAGAFAKINSFIFFGLVISLLVSIGTLFFKKQFAELDPTQYTAHPSNASYPGVPAGEYPGAFYPFSWGVSDCTAYHNATGGDPRALSCQYGVMHSLYPDPVISSPCNDEKCSLALVFAIIFPAVTGMMEGANLSGDLKDPAKSIPNGTIAAVSTAFCCYVLLVIGQAGTCSRSAMQYDLRVLQDACVNQYFVVLGVATACISTALGSMFGSARILQAIARDDLFPALRYFAKGSRKGDEPQRAVCLTYAIAQCGVFIGDLDAVAPILTNFFLITYSLVNISCFLLTISGVVNFRPKFTFFSWQSALLGATLNLAAMFYLSPGYAVATVLVLVALFTYVAFRGPDVQWGDIAQALLFRQARNHMLSLRGKPDALKFWQPSIMLLSAAPEAQPSLVACCDDLKRSGLFLLGCPVVAPDVSSDGGIEVEQVVERRQRLTQLIDGVKLDAFPHLTIAASARRGCQNLMLSDGLGAMNAVNVVLSLPTPGALAKGKARQEEVAAAEAADAADADAAAADATKGKKKKHRARLSTSGALEGVGAASDAEFVAILRDVLALKKNVLVACNFELLDTPRPAEGDAAEAPAFPMHLSNKHSTKRSALHGGTNRHAAAALRAAGVDPRRAVLGSSTAALGNPWQRSFGQLKKGRYIDVWLLPDRWAWHSVSRSSLSLSSTSLSLLGTAGGGAAPLSEGKLDDDLSLMVQFAYVMLDARREKYNKSWLDLARGGFEEVTADGFETDDDLESVDGESVLPSTTNSNRQGRRRHRRGQRGADDTVIRVMQLLPEGATDEFADARTEQLQRTLFSARVECEVCIVRENATAQGALGTAVDALENECRNVNEILRLNSKETAVAFVTLPLLPTSTSGEEERYASSVAKLTTGLPPTFLMANGQGHPVITTDI